MTWADFRTIARRALGIVGLHIHEWRYGSEYVVSGVFVESRFCGIAACQRYEIRDPLTLQWVEHKTGYPGL